MFLQDNTGLRIFLHGSLRDKRSTARDIDLIAVSDDYKGDANLADFEEVADETGKLLDVTMLCPGWEYFNLQTGLTDLDKYWNEGDTWSVIKAIYFPEDLGLDAEREDPTPYGKFCRPFGGWMFFGGSIHPYKMIKPDFSAEITPQEVRDLARMEPVPGAHSSNPWSPDFSSTDMLNGEHEREHRHECGSWDQAAYRRPPRAIFLHR